MQLRRVSQALESSRNRRLYNCDYQNTQLAHAAGSDGFGEVKMDIYQFWNDVIKQRADAMRAYFHPDAWVNWHNTNEHFTVEEFIRANCEYPGEWDGKVERVIWASEHIITVTYVCSKDGAISCHATSFIHVVDGKIASIEEYWGDDGPAPQWRQDKHIGSKIKDC